ncbi:hypothetical protein ABEB36_009592 [Hypothenemus hampei]|uniref:Uncharacterized protein n=1 Tax=Hypothenemus hampei TaxID=57062 RepID=A0ABD1EHG2_HYPHA
MERMEHSIMLGELLKESISDLDCNINNTEHFAPSGLGINYENNTNSGAETSDINTSDNVPLSQMARKKRKKRTWSYAKEIKERAYGKT